MNFNPVFGSRNRRRGLKRFSCFSWKRTDLLKKKLHGVCTLTKVYQYAKEERFLFFEPCRTLVDVCMELLLKTKKSWFCTNSTSLPSWDLPYSSCPLFDLDDFEDDECLAEFRVKKRDIPALTEALQIPDWISCNQQSKAEGTEALCILLKRFAYPCRYIDMVQRFARPVPVLSMVTNKVLDYIFPVYSHRNGILWCWTHQHCKSMPKLSPKEGHNCRTVLVLLMEQLGLLRSLIIIRELAITLIKEYMLPSFSL